MQGVQRRRLDRVASSNDRVTTIVRYEPGSQFSAHTHGGGEEFIVLSGIFQDDYGDWPQGSYIRNPPGSSHTPGSKNGCTIFVKLWQFDPQDRTFVHIDLNKIGAVPVADRPGITASPLYKDVYEEVSVENWAAGQTVSIEAAGGAEFFVLNGSFTEGQDTLQQNSWLRVPHGTKIQARAGTAGAKVWIKSGHLANLCNI